MSSPVVEVGEGNLKGCTRKNYNGEEFLAFLGIPFAKPPIGDLRFKSPQPADPWDGVRDCTDDSSACMQRDILDGWKLKGSEDCLHLNIFTRSVESSRLRPVLVYIHGGGFTHGSKESRIYGPEFLLTEEIVLVTINYRLGLLGFLQIKDPSLEVPGNAGLKDQTLALQWVQRSISKFGGDPNNVTIGGPSAGSASVHYHILSPLSKGLFQKAILQSGVALNAWALTKNNAVDILKKVGVDVTSEKEALEYLNKLLVDEIYELQEKFLAASGSDLPLIGPVIEHPNPTAFITKQPMEIILSGNYNKVPMLMGYCNREGLLILFEKVMKAQNKPPSEKEKSFEEILAALTQLSPDCDTFKYLQQKVLELYFGDGDPEAKIVMLSDLIITIKTLISAELHADTSTEPVFIYRFSLDAGLNFLKRYAKLTNKGACHGDDVGYIFRASVNPLPEKDSIEECTMKKMVKLITNFLRTGNPTPPDSDMGFEWKPVEKGALHYVDIGEEFVVGLNPEFERLKFWKEFEQEAQKLTTYLSTNSFIFCDL